MLSEKVGLSSKYMMWISNFVIILLDILLSFIVYPLILIFLAPVFLYRAIVVLIVKIVHPTYFITSVLDQTVQLDYFDKSGHPLIFSSGAMVTVNGPVSVGRLKDRWRKQFLEARDCRGNLTCPKLSVTLVRIGGYNFFKPLKRIDVKDIFREDQLSPEDVDEFKSSFLCKPYPPNGPLWEVVIVKMGSETKMFYRFHHSIADGYTQLYLLNASMKSTVPKTTSPPVEERNEGYGFGERISAGLSFVRVLTIYGLEILRSRNSVQISAQASDSIRISSTNIYFSDLKKVYRQTGAKFLAINLALYAAVLRRVLKSYGDYVSVQTALPWPNHPANQGKMGNHFSVGILNIPMNAMRTIDRIQEIDRTMNVFYNRRVNKILWWYWIPMLGIFPTPVVGSVVGWIQRSLGLKLMSSTLLSFEKFEYETDSSPVIAVKPLISRCSYETVMVASTVIYSERCEVTFVGTQAVAESQDEMERIIHEYYLQELENLLEEVESDMKANEYV